MVRDVLPAGVPTLQAHGANVVGSGRGAVKSEIHNAVRQGNMKAIRAGKSWELYDLQADPSETRNLAKLQPEKVKELADKWELWNAGALEKK